MIKKYCKGIPLYVAAVAATLFVHGLAHKWDSQHNEEPPRPALTHHA